MEKKLESVLHNFEYQARETVNAVQDRAQALKLSKDAERRIAKMRREFREQFDATVVAHTTGSDAGDEHAQPHVVQSVSVGDTVRLRSLGRDAKVLRHLDDDSFEVAVGPMKMKVPRDDVASVLVSAGANPVSGGACPRYRRVALARRRQRPHRDQRHRADGGRSHPRGGEVRRSRVSWPARCGCASCTAAAWESCARRCASTCREHPHVASVSEPPQNEGGGGATVVELRT